MYSEVAGKQMPGCPGRQRRKSVTEEEGANYAKYSNIHVYNLVHASNVSHSAEDPITEPQLPQEPWEKEVWPFFYS